ncbi:MAG: NADPH-dependent FMN reductase [Lachnospiraceae bacterium]
MSKKIGVLVGSLREKSYNKAIAKELIKEAPEGFEFEMIPIGDLPFFDQDIEGNPPESWERFRQILREKDGYLFVTPEYNRSIPGVLKNAIDIGSRPYGESSWDGKPAGVVSVSIGAIGGFGANHHLRQVLSFLNLYTLPQPEAYIGHAMSIVDEDGNVKDEREKEFLKNYMKAFGAWVNKF